MQLNYDVICRKKNTKITQKRPLTVKLIGSFYIKKHDETNFNFLEFVSGKQQFN